MHQQHIKTLLGDIIETFKLTANKLEFTARNHLKYYDWRD